MPIVKPMYTVLPGWIKRHVFGLLLLVVCLLLQGMGLADGFRFDRMLIAQGNYWLLLSAHFVHLNWSHLWLNLAGLVLVMVFFGRYCAVNVRLAVIFVSALSVALGLLWFNDNIHWYVGLSGILHGLFVVGVWHEYRHYAKSGVVLILLLVAKLIWEQVSGALPGSESMTGGHVVVDAHLYGALGGLFFLLLHQVVHIYNRQQN